MGECRAIMITCLVCKNKGHKLKRSSVSHPSKRIYKSNCYIQNMGNIICNGGDIGQALLKSFQPKQKAEKSLPLL